MYALFYIIFFVFSVPIYSTPETYRQLNIFRDSMQKIQQESLYPVSEKALIEGAIRGMLSTVDIYSGYLDTSDTQIFSQHMQGAFNGIGIEIALNQENLPMILNVFPESPAQKNGLKKNTIITHIDNISTHGQAIDDMYFLLNDPSQQNIRLTVCDNGKTHTLEIKKEQIIIPAFIEKILPENILYLRIYNFNQMGSANKILAHLGKQKNIHGLILDLRDNKGGLFEEAITFANGFLDAKEVAILTTKSTQKNRHYISSPHDQVAQIGPIIILVNHFTASAAEVFSGALQRHKRAILIGGKTYGKSSVQTLFPLERSSASLKITTGEYRLSDNTTLHNKGLIPDHIVPSPPEAFCDQKDNRVCLEDPAVIKAIELINAQRK